MPTESTAVKAAQDTARNAVKTAESGIKKAWSIMDAAAEKKSPSEYLSQRAVRSIQGMRQE